MKRWIQACVFLVIALGTGGCLLQRVVWSPDGSTAAVIGAEGKEKIALYLCDPTGKLSPPIADSVYIAAWFADGRRLALGRHIEKVRTWTEARPALSEPMQTALIAEAESLAKELADESGWQAVQDRLDTRELSTDRLRLLSIILEDVKQDPLADEIWEQWLKYEPLLSLTYLQVARINGEALDLAPPVATSFTLMQGLRVSPDGNSIAYTAPIGPVHEPNDNENMSLYVVPVVPPSGVAEWARPFATFVAAFPDWSPDGRSLVYVQNHYGGGIQLATILRRDVKTNATQELATVAFDSMMSVHCLPDGRVLFPGREAHVPAVVDAKRTPRQLFVIDPGPPSTLTQLTRDAGGDPKGELYFTDVSPDGKKALLVWSQGQVAVLDLATKAVTHVQDRPMKDMLSLPSWRSADELCLIVPKGWSAENPDRGGVVLWSPDKVTWVSREWPQSLAESFVGRD